VLPAATWSNTDAITALPNVEVLIVDDEVQARELLSERETYDQIGDANQSAVVSPDRSHRSRSD